MNIKNILQLAAMFIGAGIFLFILWLSIWVGCAMIDSCYYANMAQ